MTDHQQHSNQYPSLLITVKSGTDERSVTEIYSNTRIYPSKNKSRPTTVYYNSNHRQKQNFIRSSSSKIPHYSTNFNHIYYYNNNQQQQEPLRPLMEIQDNQFSFENNFNDKNIFYPIFNKNQPKQHGQYRNRKAELDWDHAFDLDQIDLYTTQHDIDNHSLASFNSLSDNSFSSF